MSVRGHPVGTDVGTCLPGGRTHTLGEDTIFVETSNSSRSGVVQGQQENEDDDTTVVVNSSPLNVSSGTDSRGK